MRPDRFTRLHPPDLDRLRVAWEHLRIPGPPDEYALTRTEVDDPDPRRRFARRTIQEIVCGGECLALIDKASPHSLHDLMVTEVSMRPKATPDAVDPLTGRVLWLTGLNFVRFVSEPAVIRDFDLAGGELHLAMNCDPNTRDRESIQATKEFHLHLLYWQGAALRTLAAARRCGSVSDHRARRQAIDPLTFLGAHLLHDALGGLDPGIRGARLRPPDDALTIRGRHPLGCLIELPGWEVLADPAFEDLVRRLHLRLDGLAADLLEVFTGQRTSPPPWRRHRLLPRRRIAAGIAALPLSDRVRCGLRDLAQVLVDLPEAVAGRLRGGGSLLRRHLMTLNLPSYAMNLYTPARNRAGSPLGEVPRVYLTLQPKLFSGIGGAGLLSLRGIPSVRVLRGQGTLTPREWRERTAFQRRFASFNQGRCATEAAVRFEPVRRFVNPRLGWV